MPLINPQQNEVVYKIRVMIGSHIEITYWSRDTRTVSKPDCHPYTRDGFREVKAYGDANMFLHTGGKSDWVWSAVPF